MSLNSLQSRLLRPVDNAPLVIFRIIFGFLITAEAWGAILTGWVSRTFIEPDHTFPFIPVSFLEPLPGNGMIIYFLLMGAAGFCVMLGYRYRVTMFVYALMWSGAYLMQKTNYNNHYYLLMLLCWIMCLLPAAANLSVDARRNSHLRSDSCAQWHLWIFVLQISIVYFYAAVAKMYPDWLKGIPVSIFFKSKEDYFLVGSLLQERWLIMAVSYGGVLFDLLIAPALLWKRTRKYAFIISIFFHLFNSVIFRVGIFPYLGIAFGIFFFPPMVIRRTFIKNRPVSAKNYVPGRFDKKILAVLAVYFVFQALLPLRHWLYPGNVNWTEEGHRLSWHMMLRSKSGFVNFRIRHNDQEWTVRPQEYLTEKQSQRIATHPDMAWQFIQLLKKDLRKQGIEDVEIYAEGKASLNGSRLYPLFDPEYNLANEPWRPFSHSPWILPLPED